MFQRFLVSTTPELLKDLDVYFRLKGFKSRSQRFNKLVLDYILSNQDDIRNVGRQEFTAILGRIHKHNMPGRIMH